MKCDVHIWNGDGDCPQCSHFAKLWSDLCDCGDEKTPGANKCALCSADEGLFKAPAPCVGLCACGAQTIPGRAQCGPCLLEPPMLTAPRPPKHPAEEAIRYSLLVDDGRDFLVLWHTGMFDVIRQRWPDVPSGVFPLYSPVNRR